MKKPLVLICLDGIGGNGQGHFVRLKLIAQALKRYDVTCKIASFNTRMLEELRDYVDDIVHVPGNPPISLDAPPLNLPLNEPRDYFCFTGRLWQLGFWNKDRIIKNLKGWDEVYTKLKPDAVVADWSPYALLAAAGRICTYAVGNGSFVPVVRDGYLTPDGNSASQEDRAAQDQIFANISDSFKAMRRTPPEDIASATLRGDVPCPATLPALDPHNNARLAGELIPAGIDLLPPLMLGHGKQIFIYLGTEIKEHRMALDAVAELGADATLYAKKGTVNANILPTKIKLRHTPFTIEEIAKDAGIFVHHGGVGTAYLTALAGVPQFAVYKNNYERWQIIRAIWDRGVGTGQLADDKAEKIKEAAQIIEKLRLSSHHRRVARSWQKESYEWISGRRGQDIVAQRIITDGIA